MTNNLAEDIVSRGQELADNLNTMGVSDADVEDGLKTLVAKVLDITVSGKINTILTLDTPMVVYTDKFNVTGTLTDAEDTPIGGATIQLIWNDGTEHIATGTTNNNGVFSFTSTDPASVSSYSFQLFFAGDNDYNASNSTLVNVSTEKETTILNIISPASGTYVSTDSVTVSGTLKDNDDTAMTDKSVGIYLNNSLLDAVTVGSDGTFTKLVTGLSVGSNSITASFDATSNYTGSSQSITVNRSTFDDLDDPVLVDGSQILSYADEQQTPNSQYATLMVQLLNGQSAAAISGVDVDFYRYVDGVNDVYLDTVATDSSGQSGYTYHSAGIGDVKIYGKIGSIVSETFSIQDIYKYDPMTSDKGLFSVQSGSATISYSNDGVTITGTTSNETKILANIQLPSSDYEITYDVNAVTSASDGYTLHSCFEDLQLGHNANGFYARKVSVSGDIWGGGGNYNPPCTMKLEITGTNSKTIKVYRNDVQVGSTITGISQTRIMQFLSYANNRGLTLKNLKIKEL